MIRVPNISGNLPMTISRWRVTFLINILNKISKVRLGNFTSGQSPGQYLRFDKLSQQSFDCRLSHPVGHCRDQEVLNSSQNENQKGANIFK